MTLNDATIANIRAARTVNGVPPEHTQVPFRNLRHLLSLHATVTPEKTYIIHYDAEGSREELTYAEFNAKVHQAAGFLYDDLGVRRGDRVATIAYNHLDTVILYFACWLIGAAVAPQNVSEDDRRIAFILQNSEAKICFVRSEYLARAAAIIGMIDEGQGEIRIVQMGGVPTESYLHFNGE